MQNMKAAARASAVILAFAGSLFACGGDWEGEEAAASGSATSISGCTHSGGTCVRLGPGACASGTVDKDASCNAGWTCCICPEFLGECTLGTLPADLNGDGCIDGCLAEAPSKVKSDACPEFVGDCLHGEHLVDANGDGCVDGCAK
jgi:hypothetical protein